MKILLPTKITEAMIGAGTTIPSVDSDAGEVAWVASSAYVVNDERVYEGAIYACVKDHTGSTKTPNIDFVNWLFKQPTNRMSPFDEYLYTKAQSVGGFTYVLDPGFITGFAMYGIEADKFNFKYYSEPGGEILVERSGDLWEQAFGLWEYLFSNLQKETKWTSPALPMRPSGQIVVSLTRNQPDVIAAVGWIGVGQWRSWNAPNSSNSGVQYGIEVTPKSYSYFKRNDDGTYKRNPGRTAKIVSGTAIIPSAMAPSVEDVLRKIIDIPVAVDFSNQAKYSHLSTVGFLTGSVSTDSWPISSVNFKIEGNV